MMLSAASRARREGVGKLGRGGALLPDLAGSQGWGPKPWASALSRTPAAALTTQGMEVKCDPLCHLCPVPPWRVSEQR